MNARKHQYQDQTDAQVIDLSFGKISRAIYRELRGDAMSQVLLMGIILEIDWQTNTLQMSDALLAEATGLSESTVKKRKQVLVERGYITYSAERRENGMNETTVYQLTGLCRRIALETVTKQAPKADNTSENEWVAKKPTPLVKPQFQQGGGSPENPRGGSPEKHINRHKNKQTNGGGGDFDFETASDDSETKKHALLTDVGVNMPVRAELAEYDIGWIERAISESRKSDIRNVPGFVVTWMRENASYESAPDFVSCSEFVPADDYGDYSFSDGYFTTPSESVLDDQVAQIPEDEQKVWSMATTQLELQLPPSVWLQTMQGAELLGVEGNTYRVLLPHPGAKQFCEGLYARVVKGVFDTVARALGREPVEFEFSAKPVKELSFA